MNIDTCPIQNCVIPSRDYHMEAMGVIKKHPYPTYGISWLDHTLKGIYQTELVLIGAESGMGKTTLVSNLACENAGNNLRTFFLKLEGDKAEFTETEVFRMIQKQYYADRDTNQAPYIDLNFIDYRLGNIKGLEKYEVLALDTLIQTTEFMYFWDKSIKLTKGRLIELYNEYCITMKLVILDHIGFVSMFNEKTEYQEETDLMEVLISACEHHHIPAVVVSHLRKKTGRDFYLPDKDDFIGSSNKYKIATTCIMISPYPTFNDYRKKFYGTIFRVVKGRAGTTPFRCGLQMYDGINKKYTDPFIEGTVIKGGAEIEFDENEVADFCHQNGIPVPEAKKKKFHGGEK
jgi:hypothetical protein